MPIYEYQCQKCENIEEHLMKFSDPDPQSCEKCHGPLSRLVSQTSFALKGEGWYVTDYKPKHKDAAKSPDAPEAAEAKPESAAGDVAKAKEVPAGPAAPTSESKSAPVSEKSAAPVAKPASQSSVSAPAGKA